MAVWLSWGAVALGFVSAGLWLWAAQLPAVYPMAYLDGPPKKIVAIINKQAKLNASAAACTGMSVLLQALVLMLQMA